jgi:YtxH-like protein
MNINKMLISLGAALATSKVAHSISRIDADDLLGTIGLARRRNHFLMDAALVGAGAVIGAGVALLLAPTSGAEARAKLSEKLDDLGEAATTALRDVKNELPSLQVTRSTQNGNERKHQEHHS